jgi:sec-independent protein translocase protein TatB
MLGVGWTEMLVIGVVALIVIGPKELPSLMQKLGRFAGTVRRMGTDFQRELNKTTGLDEVRNLRSAITQPLKQTTDAIRKEFNTTTSSGSVQPSGALKPADSKVESVVSEIEKQAGIAPKAPVKAAVASAAVASVSPSTATPVKARRAPKVKAAPTKPVAVNELADARPAAPAKPRRAQAPKQAKAIESPAPAEAIAPAAGKAKPKARRKPAVKKA